jgi:hypothetical protein
VRAATTYGVLSTEPGTRRRRPVYDQRFDSSPLKVGSVGDLVGRVRDQRP